MGNIGNKKMNLMYFKGMILNLLIIIFVFSYIMIACVIGYSLMITAICLLKYLKLMIVMFFSLDFTNYYKLINELYIYYIQYKLDLLYYFFFLVINILLSMNIIIMSNKELFNIFFIDFIDNLKDVILLIKKFFKSIYVFFFILTLLIINYFFILSFNNFVLCIMVFILFYLLLHIIEGIYIILEDYIYSKYVVIVCKSIVVILHSAAMLLLWAHFI